MSRVQALEMDIETLRRQLARVTAERDELRKHLACFAVINIDHGFYCRLCGTYSRSVELLVHLGNCPINRGEQPASPAISELELLRRVAAAGNRLVQHLLKAHELDIPDEIWCVYEDAYTAWEMSTIPASGPPPPQDRTEATGAGVDTPEAGNGQERRQEPGVAP